MSEREKAAEAFRSLVELSCGGPCPKTASAQELADIVSAALLRSTESDERKDAVTREQLNEALKGVGQAAAMDLYLRGFAAYADSLRAAARPTEETRSSGAEEADAAWQEVVNVLGRGGLAYAIRKAVRAEIRATKGGGAV